eukprot:CAMPEP_0117734470 /NCGR_PEP_ID=MMETSP0947-20121206/693_1 /TAXON_ID=44440 /ORGANISM="Chattonella subsalsa, Strain CCMP2191" /LENGTH=310 /DNA_ID=CAMNT_0005549255 /DNA_START=36 /DNA_END=968 /DNA_ORIENTATION=+
MIYEMQQNETAFSSAEDLWAALEMRELIDYTILRYLTERMGKQHPLVAKELVFGANKGNYGQGLEMNALAGIVSLCPMVTGQLFCIKEGNAELAVRLLMASQADVKLNSPVHQILMQQTTQGRKYTIVSSQGQHNNFDAVIIATPLPTAYPSIDFFQDDNQVHIENTGRQFQAVHTTYIEGMLKEGYFHTDFVPTAIVLAESGSAESFNSISLQTKISESTNLYKVFSRNTLTSTDLNSLFLQHQVIDHEEWKSVPLHQPNAKGLPRIIPFLDERIYHINALEDAVSCLEISTIAAKNIALLLKSELNPQ